MQISRFQKLLFPMRKSGAEEGREKRPLGQGGAMETDTQSSANSDSGLTSSDED